MGKGKSKKVKPLTIADDVPQSHDHCTCNHDSSRATDGHNVDGWTDEDIRIYNELLTERAKLEKEKNELEQKSARHQAERALLNEEAAAFDSLFKAQLSGEYRFTGKTLCCLDFADHAAGPKRSCHHEVCTRAKKGGVSWMEMDTIKYYHARITAEKSQRMKDALRKQRDVELGRVKKDDEEELSLRSRRAALLEKNSSMQKDDSRLPADTYNKGDLAPSLLDAFGGDGSLLNQKDKEILEAAKENELVVKRIRSRLDKIRHDVHSGRVTAFDARVKLDQANKEMAEAEKKNNVFKELVFTAGTSTDLATSTSLSRALTKSLATSSSDAFSQALTVMKGFFSASDPRDVQSAITDLRSVLEVNGPMSPVLQKSFQALEDMLAKPHAKGFSVDLPDQEGNKRTCTNVVEVLLMLRNTDDPSALDATAEELKLDKATLHANYECIKIEEKAVKDIEQTLNRFARSDVKTIYEKVKTVKDKAAMNSPIPPLSDIVLETKMLAILFQHAGERLRLDALHGASERDLAGKMTSIIISYSERSPDRYLESLDKLNMGIQRCNVDTDEAANKTWQAFDTVNESMSRFVEKHREKQVQLERQSAKLDIPQSLIPGPLQVKKPAGASPTSALSSALSSFDPSHLSHLDVNSMMSLVQTMQNQLKGLKPDDLVAMFCDDTSSTSSADKSAKRQLKQDLERFMSSPTGLEDPNLLQRIRKQIDQLASNEARAKRRTSQPPPPQLPKATTSTLKPDQPPAPTTTSRFQEDLPSSSSSSTTNTTPNPPPYSANEGRLRSALQPPPSKSVTTPTSPSTSRPKPTSNTVTTSPREALIISQLSRLATNLDSLAHFTRTAPDPYGFRDAFEGIIAKLGEQMMGHLEIAQVLCEVNRGEGWNAVGGMRLGGWLRGEGGEMMIQVPVDQGAM